MGLTALQSRSARWIVSLIGFVIFAFTCLRFYYQRGQESQAVWDDAEVVAKQRIQEQEVLKEQQFQESIQDIMNATLGVRTTKYFGRCSFR